MTSLLNIWQEGGFFMYPVLMFGLSAMTCVVVAAIIGNRILFGGALVMTLMTVVIAGAGTMYDMRQVQAAVAMVNPADREIILTQGHKEAMRPLQLGGGLAVLAFPLVVVAFLRSQRQSATR